MADITMCFGRECPLKPTCHRYTATPSEYAQAYLGEPPFTFTDGEVFCQMYWGDEQQKLKDILVSITLGKEK
jgi:hypothetical protein